MTKAPSSGPQAFAWRVLIAGYLSLAAFSAVALTLFPRNLESLEGAIDREEAELQRMRDALELDRKAVAKWRLKRRHEKSLRCLQEARARGDWPLSFDVVLDPRYEP